MSAGGLVPALSVEQLAGQSERTGELEAELRDYRRRALEAGDDELAGELDALLRQLARVRSRLLARLATVPR